MDALICSECGEGVWSIARCRSSCISSGAAGSARQSRHAVANRAYLDRWSFLLVVLLAVAVALRFRQFVRLGRVPVRPSVVLFRVMVAMRQILQVLFEVFLIHPPN